MSVSGIKILIADGSPVYKKVFTQAAADAADNASVTHVLNRDEALGAIRSAKYDVIVLDADIAAPGIIEIFSDIAKMSPRAVVLVAARPSSSNDSVLAEAEASGAFCMTKPIYASYGENLETARSKISDVINTARLRRETNWTPPKRRRTSAWKPDFNSEVVLIAASTGGPPALGKVLSGLSGSFPVPILIVQHTLPQFTDTLAQELNKKTELNVKVAQNGEPIAHGTAYIAPSGLHMRLGRDKRVFLDDSPLLNGVKPAADALFESVAEVPLTGALAVILTGMGRDGEKGLGRLKEKQRCVCLAQSERTCVVYGMPRAAAERGLVDKILDLDDIAGEIQRTCSHKGAPGA